MTRKAISIVSLVVVILILSGSPGRATAQDRSQVWDQVLAAPDQWFEDYFRGNAGALAQAETADFVLIQDGLLLSRAEHLRNVRKRGRSLIDPSPGLDNAERQLFGDVAILTGISTVRAEDGKRSLRVCSEAWVWDAGRWRVAMAHYAPTSPQLTIRLLLQLDEGQ